ncbi:MAG: TonB family protein [Planctomycetota bacterium]
MNRRPRVRPETLRRRAYAASAALHAVGIGGALVLAASVAPDAAWSFSRTQPSRSSLWAEVQVAPEVARIAPAPPIRPEPEVPAPAPTATEPQLPLPGIPPMEVDPIVAAPPQPVRDAVATTELLSRLQPRETVQPAEPDAEPATPSAQVPQEPADPSPAVDGGVVQPTPEPGRNEPPAYPFVAWRRRIEGTVTVLLEIDREGAVTAAHIEQSSGSSALDDAALAQLSRWRFEPARRSGVAVPGTWRQIVEFRLRN